MVQAKLETHVVPINQRWGLFGQSGQVARGELSREGIYGLLKSCGLLRMSGSSSKAQ